MKVFNKIKMFAGVLGFTSTAIVSLSFVSNVVAEEKQLFNLGSHKMIRLDLNSGATINVEAWDSENAEIVYDDKTQDINQYKIKIKDTHDGLKISSKAGGNGDMQLWFNLKVPTDTQLCLHSNGGNINVSGLTGGLSHCDLGPNNSNGSVVINSKGGSVNVNSAPQGADVKTAGGSINVTDAEKFVVAETGGGSINIETKNGSVKASTGAGNIEVKVLEIQSDFGGLGGFRDSGNIDLLSGLGDIWLYVPKDFSINLEVEIGYTNDTNGQFKVDSYFPFSLTNNGKRSTSGTPKQYLAGNTQVNSTQTKNAKVNNEPRNVKIKTTNGNVYIREI
jgi:DUF4097 and DUF4098 domain-containing protein YvlB